MAGRRSLLDRLVPSLLFVALIGVPDGAIGVVWPSMRNDLDRPLADLGVLALAAMPPYLVAGMATGRTLARFGVRAVLAASAAMGALALAVYAVAPAWPAVLGAAMLLGAAGGAVDGGVNAHLAVRGSAADLAFVHGLYGVGATAGPLVATVLAVNGPGWRWVFVPLALVAAMGGVLARGQPDDGGASTAAHARASDRGPLPVRATVMTLAAFVAYVAVEAATGAWAYTLLTAGRGVGESAAGVLVATYWGGLTLGRLALASVGRGWGGHRVLAGGVALAAVATAWLWADLWGTGGFALAFAGLGFAGVFPVLVALTPGRVGEGWTGTVVGWSIAAAACGGPIGVAAVGAVAGGRGAGSIAAALAVAMAALAVVVAVGLVARPARSSTA